MSGTRRSIFRSRRGFTLVELMIVVAIIGLLAALAIYGVNKYLAAAKTAEAKSSVGAIAQNAVTEFEREHTPSEILPGGNLSAKDTHVLCGSANPVPANASQVKGVKYQPNNTPGTDFGSGDMTKGWLCLAFSIDAPMYYQYRYSAGSNYVTQGLPGAPPILGTGFEASAQGDLDGDGTLATFARGGNVDTSTHTISLATTVYIDQETE